MHNKRKRGIAIAERSAQLVLIVPACDHVAVQWHCIDMLSNDTAPIHTFITTNHQALFIYNRTKLRDDFRCFRSKIYFRTFHTVPLNSPIDK